MLNFVTGVLLVVGILLLLLAVASFAYPYWPVPLVLGLIMVIDSAWVFFVMRNEGK